MTSSADSLVKLIVSLLLLKYITSSLINLTSDVFGGNTDGIIAAFGDINSDKLTDLFILSNKGKDLKIFLASDTVPYLRPSTIKCSIPDGIMTSVTPGDFNGDSQLDVLVTVGKTGSPIDSDSQLKIFWGSHETLNCSEGAFITNEPITGQPLVLDFNGDKLPDILAQTKSSTRHIWLYTEKYNNFTESSFPEGGIASFKIPHSHAFIDLNSDMAPDLMITTAKGYEVWYNERGIFTYNDTDSFTMLKEATIIGQSTFLDIDLDGKMDHLVPVCFDTSCANSSILARFNNKWIALPINFEHENVRWGFMPPKEGVSDIGMNTISLRVGDYDLDGYPDVIVILKPSSESTGQKAFLLQNVECLGCSFQRTFIVVWESGDLKYVTDVVLAAFYDIYNDGILDIIVVRHTNDGNWSLVALRNNYDNNACFIKVIVLSGLCYTDCPHKKVPYGVNQPGPVICYKTTTHEGQPRASCAAQLSQSAYFALQLPYVVFGLGHTPNFVDTLTIGVPSLQFHDRLYHEWTSIIPNSQMFVIPYLSSQDNSWINKLFVTPSNNILKTFAALMGAIGLITIIIFGLHFKERREDKKERLQESHRFHFDAM